VPSTPGNLLCVANFRTNAGYAWLFIESLYAAIADDVATYGVRTWVAYAKVNEPPATLEGSSAGAIELEVDFGSIRQLWRLLQVVRERNIRGLYLADRSVWHPAYALLRLAGVKFIVVHDHTSGNRTASRGLKAVAKRLARRFRPGMADLVLAVSEFVRRRNLEVDLVPPDRLRLCLNSVEIPEQLQQTGELRRVFGIRADCLVVVCAGRAAEYKGVQHLLHAFDIVCERMRTPPVLIYFGDGPFMSELRKIRDGLHSQRSIILAGYRPNVSELLCGADLCVVPSVWGEAFGLSALEPSARGIPVVASRVGGLPEIVVDRETGRLVPPADVNALADVIVELLQDDTARLAMGQRGRERAIEIFSRERQIRELTRYFRDGLAVRKAGAGPVAIPAGK